MVPMLARSAFTLSLSLGLAAPCPAASGLLPDFPTTEETCFGRVYDSAHLARHPNQSIVEIYLARLLRDDPQSEIAPRGRAEVIADARRLEQSGEAPLTLIARLRGQVSHVIAHLQCKPNDMGFRCATACDDGDFGATRSANRLTLHFGAGIRAGSCEDQIRLGEQSAAHVSRMPISACVAARDAARPNWVRLGPPLREALARNPRRCYARTYHRDHLARHPAQMIEHIAVRVMMESDQDYPISLAITTRWRDEGTKRSSSALCESLDYAFSCYSDDGHGTALLRRGPNGSIVLRTEGQGGSADRATGRADPSRILSLSAPFWGQDDDLRLDPVSDAECGD